MQPSEFFFSFTDDVLAQLGRCIKSSFVTVSFVLYQIGDKYTCTFEEKSLYTCISSVEQRYECVTQRMKESKIFHMRLKNTEN